MHFALNKELEMMRKAVREFAEKKIAPNADEWDANHYFPYKEAIKPMGELGFFGTVIPEEYDGEGMKEGWLAAMIISEEIARASSSLRVQVNMQIRFILTATMTSRKNISPSWSMPSISVVSGLPSRMPAPTSCPCSPRPKTWGITGC